MVNVYAKKTSETTAHMYVKLNLQNSREPMREVNVCLSPV